MSPAPTANPTQAVSTSDLLNKVVRGNGSPHEIKQVLNAAFDAKDYLDCITNLRARNIDPLSYINSLDKVCSCLVIWERPIDRNMAIDH